jgi:D-sedoheptulose 7-phosphate isomerase
VLVAARRARELGITTWALTGRAPNPLAALCDDALTVPSASTSAVQEIHLVAVHTLCAVLDARVALRTRARPAGTRTTRVRA